MPRRYCTTGRLAALSGLLSLAATAGDWPQWRYDAGRTAATPEELPDELHLQWTRDYPALEPAWQDPVNRDRMPYDRLYEPVVMDGVLFIGSSRNDRLTALDTRSGEEKWRYYADGPVRLPPVAWQGKVFFVSDDGYLYCVNTADGSPKWRRRASPGARKVLGNRRLVSAWPARGGPVIMDGTLYLAAGIWPFEGVFIQAIDAETGKRLWVNDGIGSMFIKQPHDAPAFAGIAPQGALAAIGEKLLVPGGRSVPGCFDLGTGKLRYFFLGGSKIKGGRAKALRKHEGGSHVCGIGNYSFNHRGVNTGMYDLDSGEMYTLWPGTTYPVLTDKTCYRSGNPVTAHDFASLKKQGNQWKLAKRWECAVDGSAALIKAGSRLYAGGVNRVSAIRVTGQGTNTAGTIAWTMKIDGTAARLLAADERLFVVTPEGRIHAFGGDAEDSPEWHEYAVAEAEQHSPMTDVATSMLKDLPLDKGWCLALGLDGGELVRALAEQSDLRIVAVDSDRQKLADLRRKFDAAGLYGTRIAIQAGDPATFIAPPYMAVLTVFEKLPSVPDAAFIRNVFRSLRPYGGAAYLPADTEQIHEQVSGTIAGLQLEGAQVSRVGGYTVLRRVGPLPGAGKWTQHNGDVGNRSKSDDKLVRLPLGLLWFGGSSHEDVLPRHGHGPSELVVGGRLFIQGLNMLSARDVYTGQILWQRKFDDLGTFGVYYDKTYVPNPLDLTYNQKHIPGANARSGNYAATPDRVYLVVGSDCVVMDPATGKTLDTFSLPPDDSGKQPAWGYIGIYEDALIAAAGKASFSRITGGNPSLWDGYDTSASRKIVVMDRRTGEVRWSRESKLAFRHNAIVAGDGRVFCIDAMPKPVLARLRPKDNVVTAKPELLALDVKTGNPVWSTTDGVFGTWLGYSRKNGYLVQAGRPSRDMIKGEPGDRVSVFRGASGEVVWDKPVRYGGNCMLHGDTIFLHAASSSGSAVSMLTGEAITHKHPLTGSEMPWGYKRNYGCNSGVCSEYLLAFRSGAAGFYDLATRGGTGNIGGFNPAVRPI
jgi:outer membrane protein assembly factor BamB